MMTSFKIPEHTRDEWDAINEEVERYETEQEEREVLNRILRSGIPPEFKDANDIRKDVSEWVSSPTKGLLLQGEPGVGKTYQAFSALKEMARIGTINFCTFDDIKHACKACFDGYERESDVIARYTVPNCLVIDDIGKEHATSWLLPIMFEVIKKRGERLKHTIVTTNHTGKELREKFTVNDDYVTAKAMLSRLSEYRIIKINGKDRRNNT